MKSSPLKRRTPLRSSTPLKRSRSRKQRSVPTGPALSCWLAQFTDTPCAGRIDPCHLIPQQLLRREVGEHVVWHPACWRGGCRAHHGALDVARSLRVPRAALPVELEAFAVEVGLAWWLERTYGERYVPEASR